jgi:hypothetical protein
VRLVFWRKRRNAKTCKDDICAAKALEIGMTDELLISKAQEWMN